MYTFGRTSVSRGVLTLTVLCKEDIEAEQFKQNGISHVNQTKCIGLLKKKCFFFGMFLRRYSFPSLSNEVEAVAFPNKK